MPKSPSGPPGLWLADRMMPPWVWYLRITWETAGVDSSPPWPTSALWHAVGRGHAQDDLYRLAVVVAAVAADAPGCRRSGPAGCRRWPGRNFPGNAGVWKTVDLLAQAGGAGPLVVEGRRGAGRKFRSWLVFPRGFEAVKLIDQYFTIPLRSGHPRSGQNRRRALTRELEISRESPSWKVSDLQ